MESTLENIDSQESIRRGRPSGSTIFDRATFLKHVGAAYRKCSHRKGDERCTQYEVASGLGIGRATLNRYLKSFGISWGQLRRNIMTVPYEVEDC